MRKKISIGMISFLLLALSVARCAHHSNTVIAKKQEGPQEASESYPKVKDTGDYARDKDRLYVSWDEVPKAKEYQYAIGTSTGETDVLDWTSVGPKREVLATDLDLKDGQTYYFNVKAKKKGLIFSKWVNLEPSDGITVDSTPPSKPAVTDGGIYTINNNELHFSWLSTDQVSGIKEYLYALGTPPKENNILNWRSNETQRILALTSLTLKDGETYYLSVKAKDLAGNVGLVGSSDGITVDTTSPALIFIKDEGKYTANNTRLHFNFLFLEMFS